MTDSSATRPLIAAGGHIILPIPDYIVSALSLSDKERVEFQLAENGFICKIIHTPKNDGVKP